MNGDIEPPKQVAYEEHSGDEDIEEDEIFAGQLKQGKSDTPTTSSDEQASDDETADIRLVSKEDLVDEDEVKKTSGEITEEEVEEEENLIQEENVSKIKLLQSKVEEGLGFKFSDFQTWTAFVKLLHRPTDPSSLAVARILFGFLMMNDILEERGLGEADLRWGDPDECRFPLFDSLELLPLHWICMLYYMMWSGAIGIMMGGYYKMSCLMFTLPYWYIFIMDKTAWNNHSYLYGILGILLFATDANNIWSVDAFRSPVKNNTDVPLWNYAIIRFQLFLLYFYAGLKKTEFDWLNGHSMLTLSDHWVFHPFKMVLTANQVDLWIVHFFGFLLDLTAGFLLYFDTTRPISFVFLTCFHFMNSQLFEIGMFPYVCLATMHLFCYPDWPKKFLVQYHPFKYLKQSKTRRNPSCIYNDENDESPRVSTSQSVSVILILVHVVLQLFLPYSHFITKGYNNWTNGLYGYSWDMMVHTWDTSLITIKVINLKNNESHFINPEIWARNAKWQRHADMVKQYSTCLKQHLEEKENLKNISIYIDSWVSLNKRFHQRMFDPNVDILKAEWHPFKNVSWVMPLLTEFDVWRPTLYQIKNEVHSWSKSSDVLFMADFPGFYIQNYIHQDISNVTLTVLEGRVRVIAEDQEAIEVSTGEKVQLPSAAFHQIHTISDTPSAYMYTFDNLTRLLEPTHEPHRQIGIGEIIEDKLNNYVNAIALVSSALLRVLYNIPMPRRVELPDGVMDQTLPP